MPAESRHIGVTIARPVDEVYAFVADPRNLPRWAAGVGSSVDHVDGVWVADGSPLGRVTIAFAPRNEYGVVDHDVTFPSGEVVTNPMRVVANDDGADVVFTVRRRPGTSEDDVDRDAAAVLRDLEALRDLLAQARSAVAPAGAAADEQCAQQ